MVVTRYKHEHNESKWMTDGLYAQYVLVVIKWGTAQTYLTGF